MTSNSSVSLAKVKKNIIEKLGGNKHKFKRQKQKNEIVTKQCLKNFINVLKDKWTRHDKNHLYNMIKKGLLQGGACSIAKIKI